MEVRPGQHDVTIAQALAHNLSTADRDFDMFVEKLRGEKKHNDDVINLVLEAQKRTHDAYALMLMQFGLYVAAACTDEEGHLLAPHDHEHGNERTFVETVVAETNKARAYETR
jgi:hypothetical protein